MSVQPLDAASEAYGRAARATAKDMQRVRMGRMGGGDAAKTAGCFAPNKSGRWRQTMTSRRSCGMRDGSAFLHVASLQKSGLQNNRQKRERKNKRLQMNRNIVSLRGCE